MNGFCHLPPVIAQNKTLKAATDVAAVESHTDCQMQRVRSQKHQERKVFRKVVKHDVSPHGHHLWPRPGAVDRSTQGKHGKPGHSGPDTAVALCPGHLGTAKGPVRSSSEWIKLHLLNLKRLPATTNGLWIRSSSVRVPAHYWTSSSIPGGHPADVAVHTSPYPVVITKNVSRPRTGFEAPRDGTLP